MTLSQSREKLLGRLRRRRTREREGLFLVEGVRSAEEALAHGAAVRFAVVASRLSSTPGGESLLQRIVAAGIDVERVDDAVLPELSDTETPQGVLLVCEESSWGLDDVPPAAGSGGRALLLDGIQDPGNLGTLVRAAAAFGIPAVVTLDGTVDPFNPKAVRAAAGALFRVRVVRAPWDEVGPWLAREEIALLFGEPGGRDVAGLQRPPAWALAVGNEGAGARPDMREAGTAVAIPMPGSAESLNAGVAGAILLYALTREPRVG